MTSWLLIRDRIKIFRQRLSRTRGAQALAAAILATYIRLIYYTSQHINIWHPDAAPYQRGDQNAIFAFWHGRLIMVPPFKPKQRPMFVLISHHNDGELITRTLGHFDIDTVRGSTSSGGGKAALSVVRIFQNGGNITITPDGPRGPRCKVQMGIVHLARLTGAAVVPVAVASSRFKMLRSWDRMHIAYPFGKLAICTEEPIRIAEDASDEMLEQVRISIEQGLNRATAKADEAVGISLC